MLIRSQNKEILLDISNLAITVNPKSIGQVIAFNTNDISSDGYFLIGKYENKEKAIKVLDSIQEAHDMNEYENYMGREEMSFTTRIFEMPQDSEVE